MYAHDNKPDVHSRMRFLMCFYFDGSSDKGISGSVQKDVRG